MNKVIVSLNKPYLGYLHNVTVPNPLSLPEIKSVQKLIVMVNRLIGGCHCGIKLRTIGINLAGEMTSHINTFNDFMILGTSAQKIMQDKNFLQTQKMEEGRGKRKTS